MHLDINHINLPVTDVAANRRFFETYFGFRCRTEKGADTFVGLINDDGMVLALSNFDHETSITYPKLFHIGFRQPDDASVDALYERLRGDGVEVGERKHMHDAWVFYLTAPGGFLIEIGHQHPPA